MDLEPWVIVILLAVGGVYWAAGTIETGVEKAHHAIHAVVHKIRHPHGGQ